MKILIHNYSNELSSEPSYLYHALARCGVETYVWADPTVSAFDVFDTVKPDVFITHAEMVTPDIVKYLKQSKNIDMAMNVSSMTDQQLKNVEDFFSDGSINVPLVFSNNLSYKPRQKTALNLQQLLPAFDLFAITVDNKVHEPICKEAIISQKYSKILEEFLKQEDLVDAVESNVRNYHLVQVTRGDKSEDFDIRTNVQSLQTLFRMYETITLAGPADFCLSQMFFDSAINAKAMSIVAEDKDNFHKGLDEIFVDTDLKSDDRSEIKKEIKKQVKQRHTPFHRAATLLKHLKARDEMVKVEKFKEQLPILLKDI